MRLKRSLRDLCDLYNTLRATKIEEYRKNHKSLTKTDLRALALQLRRENQSLKEIHSQVVQNVADRVSVSFKNYFEKRTRFPRTKQYKEYRSLTFPQSGFKLEGRVIKKGKRTEIGGKLYLFAVGKMRIFLHRPIKGTIERLTIKYEAGEWYATFLVERKDIRKPSLKSIPDRRIRGGDLGLESFITLDDSESAEYPEFLRQSEEKIKLLQRKLATKKKWSKRYRCLALKLAHLHLDVSRQREDWQNKLISELFKKADVLVLEKLNVENMLRNRSLAKSISDASWGKLALRSIRKAEMLGKWALFVDPWGTTQFCYNCLRWVPKSLADREHECPNCGTRLARDLNSAKIIKRLGILSYPPTDGGSSPAEPRPLPSLRGMVSRGAEAGSHWFLTDGGRHNVGYDDT